MLYNMYYDYVCNKVDKFNIPKNVYRGNTKKDRFARKNNV